MIKIHFEELKTDLHDYIFLKSEGLDPVNLNLFCDMARIDFTISRERIHRTFLSPEQLNELIVFTIQIKAKLQKYVDKGIKL